MRQGIEDYIHEGGTKRTAFIVAHRISTIQNCDKIVYMKQGKVEAAGTFADLMATSPEFAEFCDAFYQKKSYATNTNNDSGTGGGQRTNTSSTHLSYGDEGSADGRRSSSLLLYGGAAAAADGDGGGGGGGSLSPLSMVSGSSSRRGSLSMSLSRWVRHHRCHRTMLIILETSSTALDTL